MDRAHEPWQQAVSVSDNGNILTQVKTALKDESVITHITDRIATAVANTIIHRLDKLETNMKITRPEQAVIELEIKFDRKENAPQPTSVWHITDHNYAKTRLQHGCMEEVHALRVANMEL